MDINILEFVHYQDQYLPFLPVISSVLWFARISLLRFLQVHSRICQTRMVFFNDFMSMWTPWHSPLFYGLWVGEWELLEQLEENAGNSSPKEQWEVLILCTSKSTSTIVQNPTNVVFPCPNPPFLQCQCRYQLIPKNKDKLKHQQYFFGLKLITELNIQLLLYLKIKNQTLEI